MTVFDAHGIEHLSPSSIALFAAQPAMFVLSYLLKQRQAVGAAAHRGTAAEAGIVHGLTTGAPNDECVAEALRIFDTKAALCSDPKKDAERENVPGMVVQGLDALRPYGAPTSTQGKVSLDVEGLGVPIIGFFDLEFADHGIIVDIKTTAAIPSKIKPGHAKQVSLYTACRGNQQGRLSYISAKKHATYALENPREHLEALKLGALAIQRFLSVSRDPAELAGIVMPDLDSFYWSDPAARASAFRQWGV